MYCREFTWLGWKEYQALPAAWFGSVAAVFQKLRILASGLEG